MFKHTIPFFLPLIVPSLTWKVKTDDKAVYFTFDDGPHPTITPWVLEQLKEYNAKATFFCVGENVATYPDTYRSVLEHGHSVGNHSYNHLAGWATANEKYYGNIDQCAALVKSNLFRPPYGRISLSQIKEVRRKGYQIVMWDILTGDYDKSLNVEKAISDCIKAAQPGSVIVFHDSVKAEARLKVMLPEFLEQLTLKGYTFRSL
jgi:peptidoglycan/xylan/chitin deacetylase (PgdA/CDA1 family)